MTDLIYRPATELAALIRSRAVSPVEVVQAALDRIDAVNPTINAFCAVYPEEALELARKAEAAVGRGEAGALLGVPVAVKDFTPLAGKVSTRGSKVFRSWIPDRSAVYIERLQAAGAIVVGKTTTPEFAYSSFTHSPLWGVTRNPWDPSRSPGGSSGGAGAAVAAGCVPLAEGSDMGGSIRIPAALCGTVGLKPSLGRIPMDALPTVYDNISHFGPLTRTVADAALFLSVTEGPDDADIQSLPALPAIAVPPQEIGRPLRLAVSRDLGFFAVEPEVEQALERTMGALRDWGAEVVEVELPWSKTIADDWLICWAVLFAASYAKHLDTHRAEMDPQVVHLIETGLEQPAAEYKRLEERRTQQWFQLAAVLRDHDALLCPTTTMTAPPAELVDAQIDRVDDKGGYHAVDMCLPFNLTAQCPVISVPMGWSDAGLPTGLQIVGPRYDDNRVLEIAALVERVQPWADRRPSL